MGKTLKCCKTIVPPRGRGRKEEKKEVKKVVAFPTILMVIVVIPFICYTNGIFSTYGTIMHHS